MAKRRAGERPSQGRRSGGGRGGSGGVVLAFALGVAAATGAGYLYLRSSGRPAATTNGVTAQGSAPVPIAVPAVPGPAAGLRVAPFGTSEDVFEGGARVYAGHCASCHGTPVREARSGKQAAQQFWRGGKRDVAAKAPGEIFAEISAGVPGKGMPGYTRVLTETQMWQVALLLKSADQELPDPVVGLLR